MLVRCSRLGEVGRVCGDAQGWRAGWQCREEANNPLTCLNLGNRPVFLGGHGPHPLPGTGQNPTWHWCQETWQAAAGLLGHTVLSLFWALPVPLFWAAVASLLPTCTWRSPRLGVVMFRALAGLRTVVGAP